MENNLREPINRQYQPNQNLIKSVQTVVRELRSSNKFSQQMLADRSGLHLRFVQKLENQLPNISLSAFVDLAEGFNIPPKELFNKVIDRFEALENNK